MATWRPRTLVEVDHVSDHEDLRVSGQGQIGVHRDAAGPVEGGPGLLGQGACQGRGLDSRRPDLGDRRDSLGPPVGVAHGDGALVEVGDHCPEPHLDPVSLSRATRVFSQLLPATAAAPDRRRRPGRPRLPRVDAAEVARQGLVGQLGDLTGHLHAGRPRPHHHEGQQGIHVVAVRGSQLGQPQGPEDPSPAARARRRCSSCRARTRRTRRDRSRTGTSQRTLRESYGVTVARPSSREVTVRAVRSMSVTSPRSTVALR